MINQQLMSGAPGQAPCALPLGKDRNRPLASFADVYGNVTLADWKSYSRAHPAWFKDGLHPTPAGKPKFAACVKQAALGNT